MVARGMRWVRCFAAGVVLLTATARSAGAHPLHTSLAELSYDPQARRVEISLRVFADDFSSAVLHGRPAVPDAPIVVPPDAAMFRYVSGRFTLVDRRGQVVPLRWCGVRRVREQLFLCLRGATAAALPGGRIRNTLLAELFTDQVNIVQVSGAGGRRTLLFTSADAKVFP